MPKTVSAVPYTGTTERQQRSHRAFGESEPLESEVPVGELQGFRHSEVKGEGLKVYMYYNSSIINLNSLQMVV